MKDFTVEAKVPAKDDKPEMTGSVTVKAPETAEEAVKMFGSEAVVSNALANWKVTLQGNIRGGLRRGENQAALQARLGIAKMGVAATKASVDPKAAYLAQFQAADPKERKRMLAELQAAAEAQ
uniref:Uncharacterized protein n=1 Tax=viral metagenome TaxID=1070528 RepID=A0A6H1ZSW0_9ZZZZ